MLYFVVNENASLDKVLKMYKKKVHRVKLMIAQKTGKAFIKKSDKRREEIKKAKYKQKQLLNA